MRFLKNSTGNILTKALVVELVNMRSLLTWTRDISSISLRLIAFSSSVI